MKEKKYDVIIKHCVYEIATGKWLPGGKLPSVREAENLWGVNRLAILEAYRELVNMGLAIAKDRSGFFVANGQALEEFSNSRGNLENLFSQFNEVIQQQSPFLSLGVFRYLTRLAEAKAQEQPEIAFVECSQHQAWGHSQEISQKFKVPILPVCLHPTQTLKTTIAPFVKTLLTTGFHYEEVSQLAKKNELEIHNVPIEIDPSLFDDIDQTIKKAIILEIDQPMSKNISEDLQRLAQNISLEQKVTADINQTLKELFLTNPPKDFIVLLSPRVWGTTQKQWQHHAQVKLLRYTIKSTAWNTVIKALKLPLGFIS